MLAVLTNSHFDDFDPLSFSLTEDEARVLAPLATLTLDQRKSLAFAARAEAEAYRVVGMTIVRVKPTDWREQRATDIRERADGAEKRWNLSPDDALAWANDLEDAKDILRRLYGTEPRDTAPTFEETQVMARKMHAEIARWRDVDA